MRDETAPAKCVICLAIMTMEEERLALPCAHVFHEACITQYADCKGIRVAEACPFKCTMEQDLTVDGDTAEPGQSGVAAASADAVVLERAARAREEAAEMMN